MSTVQGLNKPAGHVAGVLAAGAAPTPPGGTQKKVARAPKDPNAPPKEPRESNFKKIYPDSARITVLTPEGKNPKREGSKAHATFALYAKSATVGDFIKNGGFYAALSWDVGHAFVKVE